MKVVKLSHPNYEYDVHSLVKAFYAEDQVTVITPETKPEKLAELEPQVSLEIELAETGAKIRVGEEDFLWDAETENLADGYKNGLKRFLYRTLSKVTGQKLPWGNLTGIRPTKIAYGMLDEGRSDAEILEFMEQSHYVSEEKALLGIDIAKRERDLLKEIHYEGGYSLYIGIPFCPTTCLYCSFTSYPIAAFRRQVDAYVDAVIKEMDYVAENFQDKVLDTVYIGGGTPTTLEPEQLDRLITALKSKFDFSTVKEFTVEAGRADSITREKLEVLHRHQVSRISVNPQTMKQETLDIIGRRNDGYHLVKMLMQSVDVCDTVTVWDDADSPIQVFCNREEIPVSEANTAYRAAQAFFEAAKIENPCIGIKIKKRIPMAAGLAGGSADAAAVIVALDRMFETRLSEAELTDIGERVGADVPFCIFGGTMLAEGIGTILTPLPDLPDCYIVLSKPEISVSTQKAYSLADKHLLWESPETDDAVEAVCNGDIEEVANCIYNKFEKVLNLPEVASIKRMMLEAGALNAGMSGSGPTVFGIFKDKGMAEGCARSLEEYCDQVFVCRPVSKGCEIVD